MPDPEYPNSHFDRHTITTQSPGFAPKKRDIYIPDDQAREWHARAMNYMYENDFLDTSDLPPHVWVDGAMPGSHLIDGVLPHKDNWSFYKLDIKSAFPSVHMPTFRGKLTARSDELGISRSDQNYLHYFMDEYGVAPQVSGLPLGGPASPMLFNLYCRDMDRSLAELATDHGLTYTRYLDDLTFSSPEQSAVLGEVVRRAIRTTIEGTRGFEVNHAKTRRLSRLQHHIAITGIAIYPDGRIQPQPETLDRMFKAFDAIENTVFASSMHPFPEVTDYDLSVVNGHKSTLMSMAVPPYNDTIKEGFRRYHHVARMVHAALEQQEEPPYEPKQSSPEQVAEVEAMLERALY